MKILAIETAGACCSVALLTGEQFEQRLEDAPRRHADLVLGMAEGLLRDAGMGLASLDHIAYGRGPGSFTGLRIAAAVAQGIAYGAARPVVGISTLAATAHSAWRHTRHRRLACAIDARMGEVYWGCFQVDQVGRLQPHGEEVVVAPEQAPMLSGGDWLAVGGGWRAYPGLSEVRKEQIAAVEATIRAEARDIAVLASKDNRMTASDARTALPVYLRNRVAKVPGT